MKINSSTLIKWGFVSLFVAVTFLYVFKGINPELCFHKQQPQFLTNFHFFCLYSSYPGGITDYIAAFFSQFFSFGWLGSLIITISVIILIILFLKITKSFTRLSGNLIIIFLPIVLMVVLLNDYDFPFSVIFQYIILNFFVLVFLQNYKSNISSIIYFTVSIFLYYLTGPFVFIIFSLSSLIIVLYKSGFKKGIPEVVPIIIFSIALPFISYKYLFNTSFKNAYFQITSANQIYSQYKPSFLLYLFYCYLPVSLLSLVISEKLPLRKTKKGSLYLKGHQKVLQYKKSKKDVRKKTETPSLQANLPIKPVLKLTIQFILLLFLCVFLVKLTSDKHKKNVVLADFYCYTEQWEKAIEVVLNDKEYDLLLNFYYNKAISGTGKFAELFFNYPQYAGTDVLFPDKQMAFEVMMTSSDYYFDLGYLAESRHYAYEIQSFQPYNPRVLKRLVICNLISGNYKEADKFLAILNDNLLSHDFVKKYSSYLKNTSLIANDKFLGEKRRFMPVNTIIPNDIEGKLTDLRKQNFLNQKALEHLAMLYLLDQKFNNFMNLLPNLKFFYKDLPPVFEEAIIMYCSENREQNISQFILNQATEKDFAAMLQTIEQFGNKKNAQPALKKYYSTKYFYYLLYNSPLVTKAKLVSKQELENMY
jgi:hypothetical protein